MSSAGLQLFLYWWEHYVWKRFGHENCFVLFFTTLQKEFTYNDLSPGRCVCILLTCHQSIFRIENYKIDCLGKRKHWFGHKRHLISHFQFCRFAVWHKLLPFLLSEIWGKWRLFFLLRKLLIILYWRIFSRYVSNIHEHNFSYLDKEVTEIFFMYQYSF